MGLFSRVAKTAQKESLFRAGGVTKHKWNEALNGKRVTEQTIPITKEQMQLRQKAQLNHTYAKQELEQAQRQFGRSGPKGRKQKKEHQNNLNTAQAKVDQYQSQIDDTMKQQTREVTQDLTMGERAKALGGAGLDYMWRDASKRQRVARIGTAAGVMAAPTVINTASGMMNRNESGY